MLSLVLRREPLALDFEPILRLAEVSACSAAVPENCLTPSCVGTWAWCLSEWGCFPVTCLCLGTIHDFCRSFSKWHLLLLMGILILPLPGFYPVFFHLHSSMIFPLYRGRKVTVVSFLEEQRLDEGAKFSCLWSQCAQTEFSCVASVGCLGPHDCFCDLRVLYVTSPIFSIIFCTLPIVSVSSVAFWCVRTVASSSRALPHTQQLKRRHLWLVMSPGLEQSMHGRPVFTWGCR